MHRYEAALANANYATLAASMAGASCGDGGDGGEEEEEEVRAALEASMRRSRAAASRPRDEASDAVAADIIRRREAEAAAAAAPSDAGGRCQSSIGVALTHAVDGIGQRSRLACVFECRVERIFVGECVWCQHAAVVNSLSRWALPICAYTPCMRHIRFATQHMQN